MFQKLLILLIIIGASSGTPSASKIDSALVQLFEKNPSSKVNIFVEMMESNEKILRKVDSLRFSSRTEKIGSMKTQLESLAASSQKNILAILKKDKASFISFWINNRVYVRDASQKLVQKLEKDPQVSLIRQEEKFNLLQASTSKSTANNTIQDQGQWNIDFIEAPQAWEMPGGTRGEGVVVATIDTGVRSTHEALRENFREEYGWFDGYNQTSSPVDAFGHGSHVTGIIVGRGGIGVAPGAQWITCLGCDGSICDESALISCGQWIVCPTRPNGKDADCSKAPHISSNSWAGTKGSFSYLEVIRAWHSAKIIPIFAIGDKGPTCGSAMSPGDLQDVIGVGSTGKEDTISEFSGRGPSLDGEVKPDIIAPGLNIQSAWKDEDSMFLYSSGTGTACPHVSGVVALMLSKNPDLSYNLVRKYLQDNAERTLGNARMCGRTPTTEFPNNVYGYGRLNAREALEKVPAPLNGIPSNFEFNIFHTIFYLMVFVLAKILT